jgi:hypothetical protein
MTDPGTARIPPLRVSFIGVPTGPWSVHSNTCLAGDPLPASPCVDMVEGPAAVDAPHVWRLNGVVSNERYVEGSERARLVAVQAPIRRATATRAALIPIRKSARWWGLPQDERRAIFEERSRHIAVALDYLPRVARRLHHSRDLGEPYDFLTWFDFAPQDEGAFDDLVGRLRETEEWTYVDAEVDLRLAR